jgi:hypothetical protein
MTTEEVNEYVSKLLQGKIKIENPLEVEAVRQLRRLATDEAQANQRLQNHEAEVAQLRINIQKYRGQREAYAQLLISAEAARRMAAAKAPPVPPGKKPPAGDEGENDGSSPGKAVTPEELAEKMGADGLKLVKDDGEVEAEVGDVNPPADPPAPADAPPPAAEERDDSAEG